MRNMFRVTYEIVTPESAEEGDHAEIGFCHPNGGRDELAIVQCYSPNDAYAMDLRTALRHCSPVYDSGRWFDGEAGCIDYTTGEDLRTSLHPPANVTPSSYCRLKKLLGVRH